MGTPGGARVQMMDPSGEWVDLPLVDAQLTADGTTEPFEHEESVVLARTASWSVPLTVTSARRWPPLGFGTLMGGTDDPPGWTLWHHRYGVVWLSDTTLGIVARAVAL